MWAEFSLLSECILIFTRSITATSSQQASILEAVVWILITLLVIATKYWSVTELYTKHWRSNWVFFPFKRGHVISLKDEDLDNCYFKLSIHKKMCVSVEYQIFQYLLKVKYQKSRVWTRIRAFDWPNIFLSNFSIIFHRICVVDDKECKQADYLSLNIFLIACSSSSRSKALLDLSHLCCYAKLELSSWMFYSIY